MAVTIHGPGSTASFDALASDISDNYDAILVVDGLVDTVLSEVREVEKHLHNYERWIGPAGTPAGETHIADVLGHATDTPAGVITSFQLTSGATKTWGTALQILGSTDCALVLPVGRQAYFDFHRLRVTAAQTTSHQWILRIIAGATAAAGVTAGTFTLIPLFVETTNKVQIAPVEPLTERHAAGTKMWAQLLHVSDDDAETMDLQFGLHGYAS